MKITVLDSYEDLSREGGRLLLQELKEKKDLLLCAATGNSPAGIYAFLAEEYKRQANRFQALRVIKLDEWGGLPMDDPGTCESQLRRELLKPLEVDDHRYIGFDSQPADPVRECLRIKERLAGAGGIDVCLLGLGMNGHIAFNEPGQFLQPEPHVANLSPSSLTHNMTTVMGKKPSFGLTLGMKSILNARLILMLISGEKKKTVTRALLSEKITTELPASFLWLHPRVVCLVDRAAHDL